MESTAESSLSTAGILLSSRSFAEYEAFFDLQSERLPTRILDCCAGASGFVAEAHARGIDAFAIDPVYALTELELAARIQEGATSGVAMIHSNATHFVFDWYQTPEHRAELRSNALATFQAHRRANPERYVVGALPELPFSDKSFDLALCSHLLFTWATEFDELWHLTALVELCRVAVEVRVFPLVLQGAGAAVDFLPNLRSQLQTQFAIASEVVSVPYEFQVGANQMLMLRG